MDDESLSFDQFRLSERSIMRVTTQTRMSERGTVSDEVHAVTTAADSSLTLIDSSLYH